MRIFCLNFFGTKLTVFNKKSKKSEKLNKQKIKQNVSRVSETNLFFMA